MASIQIKNGKYYIQFYINGIRKTKSTGLEISEKNEKLILKTKKEIEDRLKREKLCSVNKSYNTNIKLNDAISRFNNVHITLRSISHQRNYRFSMNYLKEVISENKYVTEITTEDISKFILVLKNKLTNSSMHTYIRYAKMLFNYLEEENYIPKTPFRKRQTPRREDIEIEVFTKADINEILDYANSNDYKMYVFLSLLLLIGTRPIDLVNLKYGDIKLEQKRIVIKMAKTGNLILFPIYAELGNFLLEVFPDILKEPHDKLLFEGYSVSHVGKKYRKFLRRLKISKEKRYTLKTFRKTFGTNMASLNIPTKDLMYIMGHREVGTTMKYYIQPKSEEIEKRITSESQKLIGIAEK
ncbi:MAG: tyrosine-type recombinase/integrase [Ignavibacteriae bacterium]|nr:tyrosine-type recombinase/integrase [Ignavibacteriota bacterium]